MGIFTFLPSFLLLPLMFPGTDCPTFVHTERPSTPVTVAPLISNSELHNFHGPRKIRRPPLGVNAVDALLLCCSAQLLSCSTSFELHRHEPHTRREASGYWEQRGAGPSTSSSDVLAHLRLSSSIPLNSTPFEETRRKMAIIQGGFGALRRQNLHLA